ncbi:MAG: ATP-binding protein [Bacteroidales bacterium]
MDNFQSGTFNKYERGKRIITQVITIFILLGFISEIAAFHQVYLPLQMILQLFSVGVFVVSLLLQWIYHNKYYRLGYLILTYYLIANIVVYDLFFPEFIQKIQFSRSEFFSRNMFFTLPLIAIVGFITSKRHILIQGGILFLYVISQLAVNADEFIKASFFSYLLTILGFCWVFFFLVRSNQQFIRQLHESNIKLKETQQHLVHSEKMASLGVLAAGVAHEINNPLNFIQGGTLGMESYMEENCKDHLHEIKPFLDGIQVGIKRASDIVTSLNHYSRRDDLPCSDCDIRTIIDNCLVMMQAELKGRVEVIRDYNPDQEYVYCNEGRLYQVFLNILTNASHAISGEGTITIATRVANGQFKTFITDTGCGIPEDILPRITDPFFTTKDPGKGTGLGLSITYNIIQEYKGSMSIESLVDKGTCISVTLPLKTPYSNDK